MAATTTATIRASQLRQGADILIYGDVPVTVTDAVRLPPDKPAQTVAITYRRDFAEGTFLFGQMTVPAGQTFPVYDDGEPF